MVRHLIPEKRELFLNTALRLFAAKGVSQTSTAEIAKEAGAGAGTLFLYFPTKQDLIHALILRIGRDISAEINSRLKPELSAREEFFAIWQASLQWLLANPHAYQYVQQVRDSGMIAPEVVAESNAFFAYYYEAIQKGLSEGSIKAYPVDFIGGFLYQGIVVCVNYLRTSPQALPSDEVIQMGFQIFWDGIKSAKE
ncbi:MAG TPA: TetR/AcrR family transcriptional regulator [Longilinea sp.]|nr:TetR/AcrR family transcriptional regulator [Longilinea sp.]